MDAPRPSAIRRIWFSVDERTRTAWRGAARVGVLVLCIGLASSAARSAGVSADAAVPAPSHRVSVSAPPPSPTSAPDVTLRDAGGFGDVARFVEMANGPTPTPQPSPTPEPTLVPPPPAPAEQPAPQLVERDQPAPPPPAPAEQPAPQLVERDQPAPPPPAPTEQPAPPPSAPPPAPPPAAPPPANVPWGLNTAPMDAYSHQLFDDTNARRVGAGLPALRVNGYLVGIARIRSQDMADNNYFAHTSPITGDTAFTLMDAHGVPYGWAGENLAKNNYPDAQAVAAADEALWNSPHHRENILNPNYTDMGIALVIDASGMKYFTIIFTGPA